MKNNILILFILRLSILQVSSYRIVVIITDCGSVDPCSIHGGGSFFFYYILILIIIY